MQVKYLSYPHKDKPTLPPRIICFSGDQKYNEELSTFVCRQRLLLKHGHAQTRGHLL